MDLLPSARPGGFSDPSLVQGLRHKPADFWLSKDVDLLHLLCSLKQQSSCCNESALTVMAFIKLYLSDHALPICILSIIIICLVGKVVLIWLVSFLTCLG